MRKPGTWTGPRAEAATAKGRRGSRWKTALEQLELVHPEARSVLPRGPEWRYELKYDGFRAAAEVVGDRVHLRYRNGGDGTLAWPEVTLALATLGVEQAVFDGELVVPDPSGRPRFDLVQGRARRSAATAAAAARATPGCSASSTSWH